MTVADVESITNLSQTLDAKLSEIRAKVLKAWLEYRLSLYGDDVEATKKAYKHAVEVWKELDKCL